MANDLHGRCGVHPFPPQVRRRTVIESAASLLMREW